MSHFPGRAYVVVTDAADRRSFLCKGYRGEPAVTLSFGIADKFRSRQAAEAWRALYVARHSRAAYALNGWRVEPAAAAATE